MSNATTRQPREKILRLLSRIEDTIRPALDPLVCAFDWAGSVRRMRPTVGDLDLVVCLRPGARHDEISPVLRTIAEGGLLITDGQTKK
jgi:DNA polymerase/3'-5' exonuclease PolX